MQRPVHSQVCHQSSHRTKQSRSPFLPTLIASSLPKRVKVAITENETLINFSSISRKKTETKTKTCLLPVLWKHSTLFTLVTVILSRRVRIWTSLRVPRWGSRPTHVDMTCWTPVFLLCSWNEVVLWEPSLPSPSRCHSFSSAPTYSQSSFCDHKRQHKQHASAEKGQAHSIR